MSKPAMNFTHLARRLTGNLTGVGIALGTLFFAASLTPSLVPRTPVTQGVLAGACFAAGYGLGVLWRWLWAYLELPAPAERLRRVVNGLLAAFCLAVVLVFLWRAAAWQDSIRAVMDLPPVDSAHPFQLSAVALLTAAALIGLARLFGMAVRRLAAFSRRYVPRRVANVLGLCLAALLFWSLGSNVLLRAGFQLLDASFREFDARMEPERPQPLSPERTGSPASLLRWEELGRAGREFVASVPAAADIAAVTGRPAMQPIRVYVGLGAAGTAAERAALALAELKRVDAFARAALVVVTPTGTGWVDPAAMRAVEYLHNGDIASVALQYSYLSSPLSLLFQPEFGAEAARELFAAIYAHWTNLPPDSRPKLYLHGLSLGAMNSERSLELFEMIGDPIAGALWSGPPFGSRMWREVTEARQAGSPAWLPTFGDGRVVRFMSQDGGRLPPDAPWGPMRIVYLQYASDAVTFFDPGAFYSRPAWLDGALGPDVSPLLRWYPVVTGLQLALDMAVATAPPMGYGHVYAPAHYIDAWLAVTGLDGWSAEAVAALKRHLSETPSDEANRGG